MTSTKKTLFICTLATVVTMVALLLLLPGRPAEPTAMASTSEKAATSSLGSATRKKTALPVVRLTPAPPVATERPAQEKVNDDPRWTKVRDEVVALQRACIDSPACDPRKLLMEENALAFDYALGPDHPRRAEMVEIVGWGYDEREKLNRRFEAGEIDRGKLFELLETHLKAFTARFATLLDDAEYQVMFRMRKGDNAAKALGITPAMAARLDAQHGPKSSPNRPPESHRRSATQ